MPPYGSEVVGSNVFVQWNVNGNLQWFGGEIQSFDEEAEEHLIFYPHDAEEVWTDLQAQDDSGMLSWKKPAGTGEKKPVAQKRASEKKPVKRQRVAKVSDEDEDEDEDEDAEAVPTSVSGKPRRAAAVKAVNKYRKMAKADADSDFESDEDEFEDEEDDEDDEEEEDYSDSDDGMKRKRKPAAKAVKAKPKARAGSGGGGSGSKAKVALGQKPVGVSFRKPVVKKSAARKRPPKQAPQPFVDPAGLDIEDRGVEWIVEAQCEKLMPLIVDATKHGEFKGLSMATACSGTDAPVVAMRVVQEMLERRGLNFNFNHVMSCELEPYKQSFIARNNPGVLLFPDIRTIGACNKGAKATTVYGGLAKVPTADMIVAGTSCKDFSNLKGHDRKSIEAMGTSGETFIGFCDLLFTQGYSSAILENVQGAEWDKMAHYITGELPLHSLKPNSNANRTAPQELRFSLEGGALCVSEVSEFAGVRLGAKLTGYCELSADGSVDRGSFTALTPATVKSFDVKKEGVGVEALARELCLEGQHALLFETPVTYLTKLLDMDAKEFGLPQTRTRKYMLIWRPEKYPAGADVAELWTELVDSLRVPLKYSVDSFLLSDENDRVHRFRDALQGPLGRLTARERQAGDWWGENANKDTQHTKDYRNCVGLKGNNCLQTPAEEQARPFTNWGANGKMTLASTRWWPEYISVLSQRELDLLDCFGLRCAEAGYDALHHSVWWNVSQNVGRTDVIPRPGITGCITPGGENFGPHLGRCILGYEKLLLGGIPVDKLLLGTETEVQLADLAGNAMAMPVVSAAILAALLVPAYARAKAADDSFDLGSMPPTKAPAGGGVAAGQSPSAGGGKGKAKGKGKVEAKAVGRAESKGKATAAGELIERLHALMPLCAQAESTSVLCTSETSGGVSESGIVQCAQSLFTVSRSFGARVDLRASEMRDHPRVSASRTSGPTPAQFEQILRSTAPTALMLDDASAAALAERGIELPAEGEYRLTRVVRERGAWMLGYSTCDAHAGTPLAELRISIGRLGTGSGIAVLLFSFTAALRGERGRMPPVARMLLPASEPPAGKAAAGKALWEVLRSPRSCELSLRASGGVPSYRSELGLKHYKSEEWPDELHVEGEVSVAGVYERQACRFSCVFGALWKRRASTSASKASSEMWLFVRPTVDRTAPDEMTFATSPMYKDCDTHAVAEVVPVKHGGKTGGAQADPETPFHLLCALGGGSGVQPAAKKPKKATGATSGGKAVTARAISWEPIELRFMVPRDDTAVSADKFGCTISNLPEPITRKLVDATAATLGMVAGGGADADGWHELRVLTASSTVAERRLAEAVAAPLLQFAARGGLKAHGRYAVLPRAKGQPSWGACKVSAPPRPEEIWDCDGRRTYDVEASNAFEQGLRVRPAAWDVRVSEKSHALKVIARPEVAAHRAAEALLRSRVLADADETVRIEWLCDTQRSTLSAAPMTSFTIPTSQGFDAASDVPPFFRPGKRLYERQARALGRMLQVDASEIEFDEVEFSDHALSSGVGWTLKVKATRSAALRGGVLADAVGAGKTINAIALIASRAKEARAGVKAAGAKNLKHSGATLVVAPVFCLKPVWRNLLDEFTSGLKALVIEQTADLKALSVEEIRSADVVIVACELLYNLKEKEPEAYQRHLVELAKVDDFPSFLEGRKQSRLIGSEPDILTGVWVPNSSQDPFGKSKARQEDRDIAAFFTVRYAEAIAKLRAKSFSASTKGVPLEWFEFERVIVDECHESLVLGEDDAERKGASAFVQEKAMQREKRKCAQRELLGIGQPDMSKRPIRVRRSTWGLTGTPLLSSEARITELAALCGGTYVCGNAAHWRTMERASTRDVFLRYHESASSLIYLEERTRAAQGYIDAAVMRNRIDHELSHIQQSHVEVACELEKDSPYEQLLAKRKLLPNMSPAFSDVTEAQWEELLASLVAAPSRQKALRETIERIHTGADGATKVVVFAPAGAGFEAARKALETLKLNGLKQPVLIGDPNYAGTTDAIDAFARLDIRDEKRPVVLLLSFEYSSALNLQHVAHDIIFYAPLWGEDPSGVHAAANEQQAIGRVVRIGQLHDVVVHRLLAVGPAAKGAKAKDTIERRVVDRNTSERVTRQAVNT